MNKYITKDIVKTITKHDALMMIEALSTIDIALVQHGRWIYRDDDNELYNSYWCSKCGEMVTVDATRRDDIGFTIDDLQFCPHCGAKMTGKGGEQE